MIVALPSFQKKVSAKVRGQGSPLDRIGLFAGYINSFLVEFVGLIAN